jgi:hypothetical protein
MNTSKVPQLMQSFSLLMKGAKTTDGAGIMKGFVQCPAGVVIHIVSSKRHRRKQDETQPE